MNSLVLSSAAGLSDGQKHVYDIQALNHNAKQCLLLAEMHGFSMRMVLKGGYLHSNTADPNYTMSNAEYDDAVEQTAVATDQVVANSSAQPTSGNVRITQVLTATLGACAALACQPPVGRFRGGAHGCTRQPPGDGLDSHHMPANSATAMPREMGPAIQMLPTDHRQTASYGGRATGAAYASQRALTARGMTMAAFEMDVLDAKRIARAAGDPTRYDAAITQARAYAACLQAHGMLR